MENPETDDLVLAEEGNAGDIKVSHEVVASIVRIAAQEVPGVISVGGAGGFREEIVGSSTSARVPEASPSPRTHRRIT
jgi:hypothetical protein